MTISEVQQLCADQGLDLPELHSAGTATDGTPVHTGELLDRWAREAEDAFTVSAGRGRRVTSSSRTSPSKVTSSVPYRSLKWRSTARCWGPVMP